MLRGSEMHLSGLVVSTAEGECQRIQNIQSFDFSLPRGWWMIWIVFIAYLDF